MTSTMTDSEMQDTTLGNTEECPCTPSELKTPCNTPDDSEAMNVDGPTFQKTHPKLRSKKLPEHNAKVVNALDEKVTHVFAGVVHNKPEYRNIFMMFYKNLMKMMWKDELVAQYLSSKDIYIIFKGTNSLMYLSLPIKITPSDFDFGVYINPNLPEDTFKVLFDITTNILKNVVAFFKQYLDKAFGFYKDPNTRVRMDFMIDVIQAFKNIEGITHPFELVVKGTTSDIKRMSSNSFVYLRNEDGEIMRNDVLNFDNHILLKRSPIVCSINNTIKFFRDKENTKRGHFDLFRVRMLTRYKDETNKKIDMIDVTLFHQDDHELKAFWATKNVMFVRDPVRAAIATYSIEMHIEEIKRILEEYTGSEHMHDRLTSRYDLLKNFLMTKQYGVHC